MIVLSGIAYLVALLAPLVVITVFGPFLTALSLVPLNFQLYGPPPGVAPQQQQLLVPGQQLQRLQQTQELQQQQQHLLVKDQATKPPSNGKDKPFYIQAEVNSLGRDALLCDQGICTL